MNDRELLELAARAAGKDIDPGRYDEDDGFAIRHMAKWWNPLVNDGDALRLAVKLRLDVSTPNVRYRAFVQSQDREHGVSANDGVDGLSDTDPLAATRRAIVRAAAEMGKTR